MTSQMPGPKRYAYTGAGMAMGASLGLLLGLLLLHDVPFGLFVGVGIGLIAGAIVENQAARSS